MEQQIVSADYFYFGKCPARGDFVRSTGQHGMLKVLDEWVAASLELLNSSGVGYEHYDQMPSLSFVFCNAKVPVALAGYLSSSQDASKRRFPLLTGYRVQLRQPERFIDAAPVYLHALWQAAQEKNQQVSVIQDADQVMSVLEQTPVANLQVEASYQAFISGQTISSFAALLGLSQYGFVQSLIAIGLLLQPIVSHGAKKLNKVLWLPLTASAHVSQIATFWLGLITGFIKRHNIELSLIIWHRPEPVLLVGFQGADILELSGLMQGNTDSDHWVHIENAAWVDNYLENDAGLATFEQVLGDPYLSLVDGIKLFKQVFLGV